MAISKNEIPILEFDPDQKAVIMPGVSTPFHFPPKAVMPFVEDAVIRDFVREHECEEVSRFVTVTKEFPVYKTKIRDTEIVMVQAPLGGAAAVQTMEQLIGGGVRQIIAAGCCGALVEDTEGSFYIPTAALRQEGTSYHYLPPAREVVLDPEPVQALRRVLKAADASYETCKTWTTDGFFRETKELVQARRAEGYSVVEMECAALAACARMRGIQFGQLLFTADSLANVDAYDTRNWGGGYFAAAMRFAIEAVVLLDPAR